MDTVAVSKARTTLVLIVAEKAGFHSFAVLGHRATMGMVLRMVDLVSCALFERFERVLPEELAL